MGPPSHRVFVPWAVSPRLLEMQRWLVAARLGCPLLQAPVLEGTVLTQG